jgi:ribonuclease HI
MLAGGVKEAKCSFVHGKFDPTTAEIMAATQAWRFSKGLGLQSIWLEGDTKNMVDALNSSEENWSRMGHL